MSRSEVERTREDGDVDFETGGRREMREVARHVDPSLAIRRARVVESRLAHGIRCIKAPFTTLPLGNFQFRIVSIGQKN